MFDQGFTIKIALKYAYLCLRAFIKFMNSDVVYVCYLKIQKKNNQKICVVCVHHSMGRDIPSIDSK